MCVTQTVERMHTAGVAHMDLSADNVMVQSATDIPSVKIIDFGLSRRIASGQSSCKPYQQLCCCGETS